MIFPALAEPKASGLMIVRVVLPAMSCRRVCCTADVITRREATRDLLFERTSLEADPRRFASRDDCGRYYSLSFTSSTKSIGRLATPIPAASNAAIFSAAVPAEPEMIAPA